MHELIDNRSRKCYFEGMQKLTITALNEWIQQLQLIFFVFTCWYKTGIKSN